MKDYTYIVRFRTVFFVNHSSFGNHVQNNKVKCFKIKAKLVLFTFLVFNNVANLPVDIFITFIFY